MEIWKLFLITVVSAIVVGCIAGILVGKYLVNRTNTSRRSLFTPKQRLVLLSCLGAGILTIVLGILLPSLKSPPQAAMENPETQSDANDGSNPQTEETDTLADSSTQAEADDAADGDADTDSADTEEAATQEISIPPRTPSSAQGGGSAVVVTDAVAVSG